MKELEAINSMQSRWLKKHWKGVTIFTTAYIAVYALICWWDYKRFSDDLKKLNAQGTKACDEAKENIRKYTSITEAEKEKVIKDAWKADIDKQ